MGINVNDLCFAHTILRIFPLDIEWKLIYVLMHLFDVDRSLDIYRIK